MQSNSYLVGCLRFLKIRVILGQMSQNKLVIRTSDRTSFRTCRAKWDFGSKIRLNWEFVPGLEPLDFGTAIHAALEVHYDPRRWGEDRFVVQSESMVAFHSHMMDWQKRLKKANQWDMISKEWNEHVELGRGMLRHFFTWAVEHDKHWEPLKVEIEFEVPIPVPADYELPSPFRWVRGDDGFLYRRKPGHTSTGGPILWPVVYQGRIDLVVKDTRTGAIYIVDHKTAAQLGDYEHLELDTQVSSYAWALRKMLGINIAGVIFQELRKKAPEAPRQLKSGGLSRARDQNTTAQLYINEVERLRLPMIEYQDFIDYLSESGQVYFRRIQVDRSPVELGIIERNVLDEALDMLDDPRIYPNPNRMNCFRCQFKEVCVMRQDGSDWNFFLEHSTLYERRDAIPEG